MKGRTHKPMYLLLEINYCCDLRHGVGPITTYLILTLVGVTAFALCSEHFIFFFFKQKAHCLLIPAVILFHMEKSSM